MAAPTTTTPAKAEPGKKTRKERKHVPHGTVSIQASFNNTKITITDAAGNVIAWSSSGSLGFKGSRKGTPFAAQQAQVRRCSHPGPGQRTRVGHPRLHRGGRRSEVDPRHHAHPSQWLPAAQAAPRLIFRAH
jgi:hypothetical protein